LQDVALQCVGVDALRGLSAQEWGDTISGEELQFIELVRPVEVPEKGYK
jgi:hypothetical protein